RGGVNLREARTVLCLEGREQMFFARDGPDIVQRRLGDGRHAGDEGRAAVRLHADGGAARPVDVDLRVDAWLLGYARHDRTEPAVPEAQDSDGRVVHLDARV